MKQITLCYTDIVKLQILMNVNNQVHVKLEMLSNIRGINGLDLFLRNSGVLGNGASMKLYITPKNVPEIISIWNHRVCGKCGKLFVKVRSLKIIGMTMLLI